MTRYEHKIVGRPGLSVKVEHPPAPYPNASYMEFYAVLAPEFLVWLNRWGGLGWKLAVLEERVGIFAREISE